MKTTRLAGSGVDSEATALRELWSVTRGRDVGAPRLLAHERWGRRTIFAETAVAGPPLTDKDAARDPASVAADLTSWMLLLPRRGSSPAAERVARLLAAPLDRMADAGGAPERHLVEATRSATEGLAELDLPVVFEHGDVSAPNVIRTRVGLALIDWELAQPAGLPAHDLFGALGFVARAEGSRPLDQRLLDAPPDWVRTAVGRYQRALELDPEIMPALFLCSCARVAAAHAARSDVTGLDLVWWRRQPASLLWRAAVERPAALNWMRSSR